MGTRANTTLAWASTGLILVSAPFVAYAGLEDWSPPPAHPTDVDATTVDPDTQTPDAGIGATDTFVVDDSGFTSDDSSVTSPEDGATGPRLPDGGMPSPLPGDTAAAGCQCAQTSSRGDDGDAALSAGTCLVALGTALRLGRRRRR